MADFICVLCQPTRAGALHRAVLADHVGCGDHLIKQKVDIDELDDDGGTALILACYETNSTFWTGFLLGHGANPNISDNNGWTALLASCHNANMKSIKELVNHDADVNKQGDNGLSPLMAVASYGDKCAITYLLEHGADPTMEDVKGFTALEYAAENGHHDCVSLIQKFAETSELGPKCAYKV